MLFALLTHAFFNISPDLGLSKQIQYPLIIALTPYIISKLPLLGTKSLMMKGVQPLISMVFLTISSVIVQYVVKEIKNNSQKDPLSTYIKNKEPMRVEGFEIKRDFVFVLVMVLICEFIFQGIVSVNESNKMEKAMLRALSKFHGKKAN